MSASQIDLFVRYFAGTLLCVFNYVLLARVLLSWFVKDLRNPVVRVIWQSTEPVLGFTRRLLPSIGGFDLSPILIFLLIGFLQTNLGLPCILERIGR